MNLMLIAWEKLGGKDPKSGRNRSFIAAYRGLAHLGRVPTHSAVCPSHKLPGHH